MANRVKGEVSINFEGRTYTLVLDFNALCEFETATGKEALAVVEAMEQGKTSLSDLRAMMWAGLVQRHPDITLQEAGRLISAHGGALMEAISAAFGADEGEAKPSGNARKARRG